MAQVHQPSITFSIAAMFIFDHFQIFSRAVAPASPPDGVGKLELRTRHAESDAGGSMPFE